MSRLDTLPPEILFNILSYTEPICNLNLTSYPLNALAATNKQLNAVVEEYARNLLKRHADIVPPRNARVFTCRRKWLAEICYFCKKLSKRKACFYKTLVCCFKCDKAEFPKMVHFQFPSPTCPEDGNANNTSSQTMTQAIQETHLSKLDLCRVIQTLIPHFVSFEAPIGEDPDKRDYIVSNQRLSATGFKPEWSLERGIRELMKCYTIIKAGQYANV